MGGKLAEASKALLSFVVPKEVYDLRHVESEPLTSEDVCSSWQLSKEDIFVVLLQIVQRNS